MSFFSLEKAVGDMIAPHYYAGLEVAGWDCPDHPPPAYAMLQGPKVRLPTQLFLFVLFFLIKF